MALVTLPSPIAFPGLLFGPYGTPTLGTLVTVTAAGHFGAAVFSAQEDMTITHVGFQPGAVVGSPTATVSIETVDTTGVPNGLWATNTNGTTGTLVASTWTLQALTASATITKGQVFCVKIAYTSGTSIVIQHLSNVQSGIHVHGNLPYVVTNTGANSKAAMANMVCLALGSSSTTFYNMLACMPVTAIANNTFNNTSSAKRGLKFTPTMNCRAVGVRFYKSNSSGDYNIGLYTGDASGTELSSSSTALDGDYAVNAVGSSVIAFFDNAVTLTAGTAYRVAIEPTSATNCNMSIITLPSVDYFSATPAKAAATVAAYSSLVSGTWTDSTTQIPFMDVIIDQIDNGTSSGGVVGVIGG